MKAIPFAASIIFMLLITGSAFAVEANNTLIIPAGTYQAPYSKATTPAETVNSFRLDAQPVTQADYFLFIQNHPQWQPGNASQLFAEQDYLKNWINNAPAPSLNKTPAIYVSWFAAQAYCKARGGRLPTTAEWEWAASGGQPQTTETRAQILTWYSHSTPTQLPEVGQQPANHFGVFDMHGLIWEWTLDFNAGTTSGESRGDGSTDNQFFCGGASARSADPSDYANFMRYALRNSLSARYTLANLGFRCAYDVPTTTLPANALSQNTQEPQP